MGVSPLSRLARLPPPSTLSSTARRRKTSVVTSEHDPYYRQDYYISAVVPGGERSGISALIEPFVYAPEVRGEKPCACPAV